MDKSWMDLPRSSSEYHIGLQYFLDFAVSNSNDGMILCPCKKCKNGICRTRTIVEEHILWNGFLSGYTKWVLHGELLSGEARMPHNHDGLNVNDNMQEMLHDAFGLQDDLNNVEITPRVEEAERPCKEAERFYKLLQDAEKELYPGCQNDSSFTLLLNLLKESFPEGVELPKNYYETKKIMKDLGLNYNKIDACKNDCMLYWGVNESKTKCDTCDEPRWITHEPNPDEHDHYTKKSNKDKKVPKKVIWHFPLKPRLQRLFMNSKTAALMKWHDEERTKDGVMRHPADSPAWQTFDYHHPEFAKDSRNVRLGLACDGFNPFKTMNVAHSTWPVIIIPYNMPPGDCMKKSYFMLSTLIPGPTEPGNNIDVYLQPLVAELKELFEIGVTTYDASSKENFQMRAALLWTISDFPGLAAISGWSTKGEYACPVCYKFTNSKWLDNSHKYCYMCHRIFLPEDHPYRNEKASFDGTKELRKAPPYLRGSTVLDDIKDVDNKFGKNVGDLNLPYSWKKKSILFDLPYWEKNLVRHNLDVMHIEKNVCDKVLYTLIDSDKSKDNYKARLDLQKMGIRAGLHPFVDEFGKEWIPTSSFTLDKIEKERFCKVLKNIKVPDGYAANISRCVHFKPTKIFGLKSHDSHILMQQLLPISLRKLLPKSVRLPLIHLSRYFRDLCSKTLCHSDLTRMEKEIAVILCQLEKIFPPAFFDIMVHLTVHLVTEAKLAGPVHYRWMCAIER
ncbi:hypothetical protein ACJIZ3_014370 [Penstemon smallii]|uniref:Transposase n=1 Tax=Penstemon smallii TaxID=265156 RepID=A0ABD3RJD1_9LAMI